MFKKKIKIMVCTPTQLLEIAVLPEASRFEMICLDEGKIRVYREGIRLKTEQKKGFLSIYMNQPYVEV